MEDDESKLFELNMALPLFKMISIDEGMKNVETETDIGTNLNRLIHGIDCINLLMLRSFDRPETVNL